MRVDLPAPLSPTSATTSPAWTSKSTSVRASTAPNRFVTPFSSRSGLVGVAVAEAVVTWLSVSLLDAVLLTRGRECAGADVGSRPVLVLDDGRLDIVGEDRRDRQLDRRNVDRAVVLLGRRVRGLLALDESHGPL